jgi:aspartyl-tRNA(Asn)/glutamyl-tRNA(Gln) amidotransferase subunit B
LEEDAGKSLHDEAAGKADSKIDLNRTGTPLLEIVSQPDMRSPAEAKAYLTELKLLLTYLEVSDCNMQEGSLRVDANINLHVHVNGSGGGAGGGEKIATPIVEIKNMNSFRAVERALAYEAQRQFRQWEETGQKLGDVPKQTRGWDDAAQVTRPQRSKEESHDYRYFPDPDLVPITLTEAEIDQVRAELGELPADLRNRLETTYAIKAYDADVLVNQGPRLVDYFLDLASRTGDGRLASNWMQQDVLRTLGERQISIDRFSISTQRLAALLLKVRGGEIDTAKARDVFAVMLDSEKSPDEAMAELGIARVDESDMIALCREILAANPAIVADYKAGKTKALGGLVGQVKKRNPNVNPGRVQAICLELLAKM